MTTEEEALGKRLGEDGHPRDREVAVGTFMGRTFRCEGFRPLIVFGPQRSGKTTGVVIPAVLEWQGPCLVTSVRTDVITNTLTYRRSVGKTYIFDPAGTVERTAPAFIDNCYGWTPLDKLETWDDAVRRAHGLAEGAGTSGVMNEEFWNSQARLLLAPLLYAAAVTGGAIGDVLRWLNLSPQQIYDEIAGRLGAVDPYEIDGEPTDRDRCRRAIEGYLGYPEVTFGSTCATAATMLEVFTYSEVERRCRENSLRIDELLDGGQNTLYMCAPVDDQDLFRPLFTSLVREVLRVARRRNEGTDRPPFPVPLMLCLDEAGNIARLEDLDRIATTSAGSGIQLVSVFHDMSQLNASYGEDRAQLIINNHSGKLFLPGNSDPRSNKFLVENLATITVRGRKHRGWAWHHLRTLGEHDAICIYGPLTLMVGLRRNYQDPELLRLQAPQE